MNGSEQSTAKEHFITSCKNNDVDTVTESLSNGGDVNWRSKFEGTAGLHVAADNNYVELLELLLTQTDVNVNITDRFNMTALMFACARGHESIVRRLTQMPAIKYNLRDSNGHTAVHLAVNNNRAGCVEVLRGEGASINWNVRQGFWDKFGRYPLTMAVSGLRIHPDILQTILSVPEPQLDLSVTNFEGDNVAKIAVEVMHGAHKLSIVEVLSQDRRVNWNIKNYEGDTPLMYCLKNNKPKMASCLINTPGVDLATMDRDAKYLENIARERNLTEILEILENITSVRLRMIQQNYLLYSHSNTPPTLLDISRNAVLVTLITSNTEERLVKPLVDRLEGHLPRLAREFLYD